MPILFSLFHIGTRLLCSNLNELCRYLYSQLHRVQTVCIVGAAVQAHFNTLPFLYRSILVETSPLFLVLLLSNHDQPLWAAAGVVHVCLKWSKRHFQEVTWLLLWLFYSFLSIEPTYGPYMFIRCADYWQGACNHHMDQATMASTADASPTSIPN